MSRIIPEKAKELRGLILYFLFKVYPENIERTSVHKSFYHYWKTEDIDRALEYLCEKDYLHRSEMPDPFGDPFGRLESFRITTNGIDVCEGTSQDDGVLAEIGR